MFPKPVKKERKKRRRIRARRHRETRTSKTGHAFLYGRYAHMVRRMEIFERAGGKVGFERDEKGNILPESIYTEIPANCQVCTETHQLFWKTGEGGAKGDWIHTEKRHCDCLTCGLYGCRKTHRILHHGREF